MHRLFSTFQFAPRNHQDNDRGRPWSRARIGSRGSISLCAQTLQAPRRREGWVHPQFRMTCPTVMHEFSDDPKARPVYLHPQLVCDTGAVVRNCSCNRLSGDQPALPTDREAASRSVVGCGADPIGCAPVPSRPASDSRKVGVTRITPR